MVAASGFFGVDGGLVLTTGYQIEAPFFLLLAGIPAGVLVESEITLPEDARIERAEFTMSASHVLAAEIASIASVRGANPQSGASSAKVAATIDFGRLLNVGDFFGGGAAVSRVFRWNGAAWSELPNGVSFPETVTDRLLVESNDANTSQSELVDALLGDGTLSLPAIPSGLELVIDGTTVWFDRQGSGAGLTVDLGSSTPDVSYIVDRTDALRQAFANARAEGGIKKVKVTLRTVGAGQLSLTPSVSSLRVHTHQFPPDGLVHTFDLVDEGQVTLDVTPPAALDVREISAVVRGSFGPERVQPALGPAITPDATLVLAPGRVLLLGLSKALTDAFADLTGVRVNVAASASGGELTGRLLADVTDLPGDTLDQSDITPLAVAPATSGWITLRFTKPVKIPPTPATAELGAPPDLVGAWLELQATYGELDLGVTTRADGAQRTAPIRRRLPGGGTATVTVIPDVHELQAAVRLVGHPDRDRPIPAVTLGVERADDVIGVTPTSDDLSTRLTLAAPLVATPAVTLTAIVAAPGSLTLDTINVTYKENA